MARHRPIPLTDPVVPITAQHIQHPRQCLKIDMGERVRGEGGDEGGGGVEGGDEDIDIGGDTESTSTRDDDDSSRSSSNEDGDDDDDNTELENVPSAEGGGG